MLNSLSDNTKAILLLTAPLIGGSKQRTAELLTTTEYNRLAKHLRAVSCEPANLLSPDPDDSLRACGDLFPIERIQRLLNRGFQLSQAYERWQARSIWVVSRADPFYTKRIKYRLKESAPAILYGCGTKEILDSGGLAIVGSRNTEEAVLMEARRIAEVTAQAGKTVVSGGARGVDQAAMRGAIEGGGKVTGVLADGLEKASMNRAHRDLIMQNQLVLVSPYDPDAGFNIGHAMQRNKLIYAFSDACVVVDSDHNKGGTWQGAVEQLERLHLVPVYVRSNEKNERGIEALRDKGALPWPQKIDGEILNELLNLTASESNRQTSMSEPSLPEPPSVTRQENGKRKEENLNLRDLQLQSVPLTRGPSVDAMKPELKPAEILFATAKDVICNALRQPKKQSEIEEELMISKSQAREWLGRLMEAGVLDKQKTGRFVLKQRTLLEYVGEG